ncbi:hypothetical protein B0H10DRAFT_2076904 [Mycena sp. CBHHK59/15]|nr:hypothetical protein B0H10DRAFT_2076904 [Mycena sp. CBHHK59/15]
MLATTSLLFTASLIAVANAHFQLQFPLPRGPFVEDDEPNFCDGYDSAVSNRTVFPLTGGFWSLNSEHTSWTAGVTLSTKADPANFEDFSTVIPFFQASGEGIFCFNLDFSKTNATGLKDGQNVTLEIVFDGGDGQLYQCADLTLSSTAKIASTVSCKNTTSTDSDSDSSAGASGTGSATAPAPSTSATNAPSSALALRFESGLVPFLVGLLGVAAVVV